MVNGTNSDSISFKMTLSIQITHIWTNTSPAKIDLRIGKKLLGNKINRRRRGNSYQNGLEIFSRESSLFRCQSQCLSRYGHDPARLRGVANDDFPPEHTNWSPGLKAGKFPSLS